MLKQISVFIENKPGRINAITDTLKTNGIDIRAMTLADTTDFGVMRFILNDAEKALKTLKENNFTVTTTDVIAVEIPDQAGSLSKVMDVLYKNEINIRYIYAFLGKSNNKASIILRVNNNQKAMDVLSAENILQLNENDLQNM